MALGPRVNGGSDRQVITVLLLIGSMLGNFLLLSQLFVGRPEYVGELRDINRRLARIEKHIGIYAEDDAPPRRDSRRHDHN